MSNEGEVKVDLVAENGSKLTGFKWQNLPGIKVPVIAVKHLARKGARVSFWDGGGVIKLPDGHKIPFHEVAGVYFVKMKVMPPEGSNLPPFGGRGS